MKRGGASRFRFDLPSACANIHSVGRYTTEHVEESGEAVAAISYINKSPDARSSTNK